MQSFDHTSTINTAEAAMRKDEIEKHVKQIRFAENKVVRDVYKLLEQSKRNIVEELSKNPSEFRAAFLQTLLDRINKQVADMEAGLNRQMDIARQSAQEMGKKQSKIGNVPDASVMRMVGIDPEMLNVLAQYHASLIQGVSDYTRAKVTEIVRRSMMTGKSAMAVQREIGSAVRKKGAFKTIGLRAETIFRTEYGRVLEMANQADILSNAEHIPGLKKRWICTFRNSRDPHMSAHNQLVDADKPFIVDGEKLMYPKDPDASAGNTINCRCISVPVVPNPDGSYDDGPDIDLMIKRDNSPLASRPKPKKAKG